MRRSALRLPLLLALAWFSGAACEGENLFVTGTDSDSRLPTVEIQQPVPLVGVPLGDSLLLRARLRDDAGISNVEITGVALRGDADLGAQVAVKRLEPKEVAFSAPVRDTILRRYLHFAADTTSEPIYVIVRATDGAGNTSADTVRILVGGPKVEIRHPVAGQSVSAGQDMGLRTFATDRDGIARLELDYSGAATGRIVFNFDVALDTVVIDTMIPLPAGAAGLLELRALARSSSGTSSLSRMVGVHVK